MYGDVNLNLIDGSAIWVQSMVLALARAGCAVTLVLKAPVQTDRLLTPLEGEPGVTIRRPAEEQLARGDRARRAHPRRRRPRCWPRWTRSTGTTSWCCAAAGWSTRW